MKIIHEDCDIHKLTILANMTMLECMDTPYITIKEYEERDWPAVWAVLEPVFRAGETYPYPTDISEDEARKAWVEIPQQTYVAMEGDRVVGTYYIKPNQPGQGAHVCNCGYVTATDQRGRGIGTGMCGHSIEEGRKLGFKAMQYNLVVSTNEDALHIWQKMGFKVTGRLPKAFNHPRVGLVDAVVMYLWLGERKY
jgi:L-amino acid N-acyltransferase YncA